MYKTVVRMALAATVAAGVATDGFAQPRGPAFETIDESRQRHGAERWREYERRGYRAPLGGYPDRLGDPAPIGTERPGYVGPQPYGLDPGKRSFPPPADAAPGGS